MGLNHPPYPPPSVGGKILAMSTVGMDDASKKIRKPYTITKSRENWTEQEHDKFLEALQLFDRDWKKIEAFVGSKTVIQIRSHAQKYFLKVQKNGSGEHVPPPRPKRKSAQPYPQKASKSAPITHQASGVVSPATRHQEQPFFPLSAQPCTAFMPGVTSPAVCAWVHHILPSGNTHIIANGVPTVELSGRDCLSSIAGASHGYGPQPMLPMEHGSSETCIRAIPDFAEVYNFIGSVFDANETGHLKRLKDMAPIDRETVLLLMKNLSLNLSNPNFEEHKFFLQAYNIGVINAKPSDLAASCMEDQSMASCLASPLEADDGDDKDDEDNCDDVNDEDIVSEEDGCEIVVNDSVDMDSFDSSEPQALMPVYLQRPVGFCQCTYYDGGGSGSGAVLEKELPKPFHQDRAKNKSSLPKNKEVCSSALLHQGSFEAVVEEDVNVEKWWS